MTRTDWLIRSARLAVVAVTAVLVGVAVTFGGALVGHEILVLLYGEDLAPIDDTLPMLVAVRAAYLAGFAAGMLVLVVGWRHFVRRGPASGRD